MPATIPDPVSGLITRDTLFLARCYQITRTDNTKFRFTDHDATLTLLDGFSYSPQDGISPSASSSRLGIEDDYVSTEGVISDSAITHADLRGGLFDDAEVIRYTVDWRYPYMGVIRSATYFIAEVEFTGETWKAKLEGVTRLFKDRVGETYDRNCKYDLGRNRFGEISTTSGCQFDVDAATKKAVTVATVVDARRIFTINGTYSEADDYFNLGRLTWTDGDNIGIISQVADWTLSTKRVELQVRVPFDIQVGDVLDMEPGCDKIFTTCRDKFSNEIHFGGFHLIPGTDKALQTPTF